ncbi:MAG: hypothetical protein M3292_00790 [Actinomycetota bacterium]|nr:hypothetical protein [Actinomycetota bacterium]
MSAEERSLPLASGSPRASVRLFPTLLVVALLAGSAGAFALFERLKLRAPPITGPRLDAVFSPVCRCPEDEARIRFRLRRPDRVTVTVVRENGERVRTLLRDTSRSAGVVHLTWNGRDAAGALVADGTYRVRVRLAARDRTITIARGVRVDTTPPALALLAVHRRPRLVLVRYHVSEKARVLAFVRGRRVARGRIVRRQGQLRWFGGIGGKPLPAGRYRLSIRARDLAGNLSRPPATVVVTLAAPP